MGPFRVTQPNPTQPNSWVNPTHGQSCYTRVCEFWLRSVEGFLGGGRQIFPFSIGFHRRPYNTLAKPSECVIELRFLRPAQHKIGHIGDVLTSQLFAQIRNA